MRWPNMNLGAASDWGRAVQSRMDDMQRAIERKNQNDGNANKGQNSTANSLGRQIQDLQKQAQQIIDQQTYLAGLYSKSMTKTPKLTAVSEGGEGYFYGEPEHFLTGIISTGFVNVTVSSTIRTLRSTAAMMFEIREEDGTVYYSPNLSQSLRAMNTLFGASFSFPVHVASNRRFTFVPKYYYFNPADLPDEPAVFSNRAITIQVLSTLDE
jgi:hypothetical protein